MALGMVNLSLGMNTKNFEDGLKKVQYQLKKSIDSAKVMMITAAAGSYLMTGANEAMDNAVKQMRARFNFKDMGLLDEEIDQIAMMADQFELMGANAEQAQLKIAEFVIQGKAVGLKEIGIYLDKDTIAMMKNADQAERLQFVMSKFPDYLDGMKDTLPETTQNMLQMRKTMDDLREAMGITFLGVIKGITDAFGGIVPAMKTAIIAFTAYKTAMILGNVGIGISKAIAQSGVFGAPIALAMGIAALASIGALIGGASLAVNALNSLPDPNTTPTTPETTPTNSGGNLQINIKQDKFGSTAEVVNQSGGSGSSSIQTNFGG